MLEVGHFLMRITTSASESGKFKVLFHLATRSSDLEYQFVL